MWLSAAVTALSSVMLELVCACVKERISGCLTWDEMHFLWML